VKAFSIFGPALPTAVGLTAMAVLSSPFTARLYGAAMALIILVLPAVGDRARDERTQGKEWIGFALAALLVAGVPWLVGAERWEPAATARSGGLLWDPRWRAGIAGEDLDSVLVILIGSTTAFAAIYISSLIDFVYVQPLMSGSGKGPAGTRMPCQSSMHLRWKTVSRIWLAHRLFSTLGFVLGMTVVVAIAVTRWVTDVDETTAAAVAAAATLLAGFYLTRARSVMAYLQNPSLWVGDAVEVIDEETSWTRRYYVQDVSLEGFKLIELPAGADDNTPKRHEPIWPSHDRMLDLPDILRLVRTRRRFLPCGDCPSRCKRVNPSCPLKDVDDHCRSEATAAVPHTSAMQAMLALVFLHSAFRRGRR
jgi:hypothetical protein